MAVLKELASLYSELAFMRSYNGPDINAHAMRKLCESSGTSIAYIGPVLPWQLGFAESFNSRFRDEFLITEQFATMAEGQGLANRWPWEY